MTLSCIQQPHQHLNAKLDTKIAMKQKMKSILTAEQYEKWTKMKTLSQHKSKGKKRA